MATGKRTLAASSSVATDVAPSPLWSRAMPPGPDRSVKITQAYAKHVARDAFFWAWPLVNVYNKRLGAEKSKELAYAGPVPGGPLNRIVMLTDYFTRTAVAKSNIFVNAPIETKYFYQDLDASGARLNGANRYVVTFPNGQTPPVNGFWSLTLYNEHHFFSPNAIDRYSVGTKNKDLKPNPDGSLPVYVQAGEPPPEQRAIGCRRLLEKTSRSTYERTGRRWQSRTDHGRRRQCRCRADIRHA